MPPARKNNPQDSLAGTASERVRSIIEAAEASAAAIRAEAEAEAELIRNRAEEQASVVRSEVRHDVQGLLGSIRTAVDRLRQDLGQLEERLGGGEAAAERPDEDHAAPVAAEATAEQDPDIALAEDAAVGLDEPEPGAGGDEGARLVALNMALNDASRDEIARHLRDAHGLSDPAPLIDEVFSSIGR